ncbi:glycosyltransferase family 2 protein [Candidatus Microgenomates bacterium]|nr:MAG: glycosyltransferase family 2 protein [Candidatus Microgenomates bacterium]
MKIGIVILNYNGESDTGQCLESINKLDLSKDLELKVVVVDNASKQELRIKGIEIIRNKKNLGFAGGNNIGIRYLLEQEVDYILILNNDTIVDKNLVNELIETAKSNEKIGIVVPKIYFEKGYEFHKERYKKEDLGKVIWYAGGIMNWKNILGYHKGVDEVDCGQYSKVEETEIGTGCCMLIKKEVLKRIGLFDEKYFLYYEDADLSQRVKKAGYKIIFSPKAIIWHKNAGSTGGSGSDLQDYYISRNRIIFGFRYASLRTKIALIKESIKLLFFGRPMQKKGITNFYFGKFIKSNYPSN